MTTLSSARLYRNHNSDLSIQALTDRDATTTPGNVGICLCGGGSRALSAGMGQLRALNFLCTADGRSLLSQTKSISTVSGGSWLGISFEFQQAVSDNTFLGTYIKPEDLTVENIEALDSKNIGYQVSKDFSVPEIAIQALYYHMFCKTPTDMLWQTVIGKHILFPYGLYKPGEHNTPTQAFSYDSATVKSIRDQPGQSPELQNLPFLTLSKNDRRPYFICNTSMFVEGAEPQHGNYRYLAPVQCTPYFSGIVGAPSGVDANNQTPGGGGATSYAFNSDLHSVNQDAITISQQRAWSVMDIVGASSAAFAETIINMFQEWKKNPSLFLEHLQAHSKNALIFIQDEIEDSKLKEAQSLIGKLSKLDPVSSKLFGGHEVEDWILRKIFDVLGQDLFDSLGIDDLVPRYDYWPVTNAKPAGNIKPTEFADGGSLENTGVASTLSYSDIDHIISFVNSPTLITPATGQDEDCTSPVVTIDETTKVITTEIEIDAQIPVLFGYQPFLAGKYEPYNGGKNACKKTAYGVHNKVFEETAFVELLEGLWGAAQGSKAPAIYKQILNVVDNPWFGVKSRKCLTCVWVYTSSVTNWEGKLHTEVGKLLAKIDKFPNIATTNTELSAVEINLLSSLSSWSIVNDDNKQLFIDLYEPTSNHSPNP